MVLYVKTRGKPSHLTKPSIQCPHNCARAFSFDSVNSGQAISDVLRCRLQDSLAPTYLLRTIHPLINLESGNCIKASSLSLPNARTLTLLSCPRWNCGCPLDTRSTLPHNVARTRSLCGRGFRLSVPSDDRVIPEHGRQRRRRHCIGVPGSNIAQRRQNWCTLEGKKVEMLKWATCTLLSAGNRAASCSWSRHSIPKRVAARREELAPAIKTSNYAVGGVVPHIYPGMESAVLQLPGADQAVWAPFLPGQGLTGIK
jgi:hypothetical protein